MDINEYSVYLIAIDLAYVRNPALLPIIHPPHAAPVVRIVRRGVIKLPAGTHFGRWRRGMVGWDVGNGKPRTARTHANSLCVRGPSDDAPALKAERDDESTAGRMARTPNCICPVDSRVRVWKRKSGRCVCVCVVIIGHIHTVNMNLCVRVVVV